MSDGKILQFSKSFNSVVTQTHSAQILSPASVNALSNKVYESLCHSNLIFLNLSDHIAYAGICKIHF